MDRLPKEIIELVKKNKGKMPQAEIARMLKISPSSVCVILSGKKHYNAETQRRYKRNNKDKVRVYKKRYWLKNKETIAAKNLKYYYENKILREERNWEQIVLDGIETYHVVMRKWYKSNRLKSYKVLIYEMKSVERIDTAKQKEILTLHNSKKEKRTKVYDFENTQRWNMKLTG
jgi:DNA-binding Lrp family transcriptional regulator